MSSKKLSGADSGASVYLSAIEYLGEEEVQQESIKLKVVNIIDKNIIEELQKASKPRAAWVREAVQDITQRVV